MTPEDVIVAVASPPGAAPRGIVRLSGRGCRRIVASLGPETGARGVARGRLDLGRASVPVLAAVAPGPRSYTGEDTVEIQLAGQPVLLERVVRALLDRAAELGIPARRAEAGEFTARAFLGGRLSLTEAEGVAATVAARSDAELRAARLLTDGSLGAVAARLADGIAEALALVEAGIDFTDQEDVVAIAPAALADALGALRTDVRNVLDRAVGAEDLRAIPLVVLAGPANAGKSTLFNALLGRERVVVADLEGTTRDVITEPLTVPTLYGEAEVLLADLAGLDEATDAIGARAQAVAREACRRAELVLRCTPAGESTPEPAAGESALLVWTKCDRAAEAPAGGIATSAAKGAGLAELAAEIGRRLGQRAVGLAAGTLALRPRHEAELAGALSALDEAAALVEPSIADRHLGDPELVAAALRAALDHAGRLAGAVTPDDVLGRIFAGFCVGK